MIIFNSNNLEKGRLESVRRCERRRDHDDVASAQDGDRMSGGGGWSATKFGIGY